MTEFIAVDDPVDKIRRITLNRPEKRNAINNGMRRELFAALEAADADDAVHATIIRGSGPCFSAGYDLKATAEEKPYYTAEGDGMWSRHVTEGWTRMWDLAKPVIAQVHGYAMAGGTELASACDLVYVAEDAQMGYPAVRFGVPDMHFHAWFLGMRKAMEMMITGKSISGLEAVEYGWANAAYPVEELEERVLEVAQQVATMPTDVVALNKRIVHRGMEIMGLRTAIRQGTEMCALGTHTESMRLFVESTQKKGLTATLSERDGKFGDYRTSEKQPKAVDPTFGETQAPTGSATAAPLKDYGKN
jgi:enoyl-CoA hydratase